MGSYRRAVRRPVCEIISTRGCIVLTSSVPMVVVEIGTESISPEVVVVAEVVAVAVAVAGVVIQEAIK